jgi:putative hydrolase of the HAD superfamily
MVGRALVIRAIAFDWGGVFTEGTFDSSAVRALASLHDVAPSRLEEPYLATMGPFEDGAFDLPEFQRRLAAATGLHTDEATFRRTFLGAVRWRAPMLTLLATLPPTYTVGVLSNNVPELCDVVRDDPRMQRVERWVFSNEIGVRKPHRAAFEALSEALGHAADETVFIDDNARNIAACQELGFTGLLVDDLAGFAGRWRRALPDLPLPPDFT